MRRIVPILTLATLLVATSSSRAGLVVTVTTGMTGADTKINSGATSEWNFQLLHGSPTLTEIDGKFDMKIDGNAPTSNITLTLYEGFNGNTTPGATVLGHVTLTPASFTNNFGNVFFDITGLNIASGVNPVDLSLALTSSTPSNKTYHIKGGDFSANSPDINTGPPVVGSMNPAPEPSTLVAAAWILVPVGMTIARRRRRGAQS